MFKQKVLKTNKQTEKKGVPARSSESRGPARVVRSAAQELEKAHFRGAQESRDLNTSVADGHKTKQKKSKQEKKPKAPTEPDRPDPPQTHSALCGLKCKRLWGGNPGSDVDWHQRDSKKLQNFSSKA